MCLTLIGIICVAIPIVIGTVIKLSALEHFEEFSVPHANFP
jgi:hypothetical protein